jgi:mannosyltransferase
MCRWNSGLFYKHPALADTQYYWRVEPNVHFFCDVDYDVFRYMQDNNKTYGFTINLYDAPASLPSLWPETIKFLAAHQEYIHENNAMDWLKDSSRRPEHNRKANGYSTCHFWSNFEIADMTFWRSQAYEDYFNHLDRAGGFFYERWGDAPVHSIAVGLFEDASKVHWLVLISLRYLNSFVDYFNLGSVILGISISPSSIVQTRRSVLAVLRDGLRKERHGSIKKTAVQIGSNTLVWANL